MICDDYFNGKYYRIKENIIDCYKDIYISGGKMCVKFYK